MVFFCKEKQKTREYKKYINETIDRSRVYYIL